MTVDGGCFVSLAPSSPPGAPKSGGQQVWEVKAAQVWQVQDQQWSQRSSWLIWAKNIASGEEKYFLSNASATAKVRTLVRVAFRRWNVEKVQADSNSSYFQSPQ
jgi:hypothetical protein